MKFSFINTKEHRMADLKLENAIRKYLANFDDRLRFLDSDFSKIIVKLHKVLSYLENKWRKKDENDNRTQNCQLN